MKCATLKRIMEERNMSQSELAEAMGMKKSNVSVMCNNDSNPRESTLKRLAAVLGVSVDDLLR